MSRRELNSGVPFETGVDAAPVSFEAVVAAWDGPLYCQTRRSRKPCRNQAWWIAVDSHARCEGQPHTVFLCTFHTRSWLQMTREKVDRFGYSRCGSCGESFTAPFRPL